MCRGDDITLLDVVVLVQPEFHHVLVEQREDLVQVRKNFARAASAGDHGRGLGQRHKHDKHI